MSTTEVSDVIEMKREDLARLISLLVFPLPEAEYLQEGGNEAFIGAFLHGYTDEIDLDSFEWCLLGGVVHSFINLFFNTEAMLREYGVAVVTAYLYPQFESCNYQYVYARYLELCELLWNPKWVGMTVTDVYAPIDDYVVLDFNLDMGGVVICNLTTKKVRAISLQHFFHLASLGEEDPRVFIEIF